MSKYLYYYNFLFTGNSYLLKTSSNVKAFSFNNSRKKNKEVAPGALLFFDETMAIYDDYTILNYKPDCNKKREKIAKTKETDPIEFISEITGTLIEKKLMTNSNQLGFHTSSTLLEHFDILISNLEFKLIINLSTDETVTVFYDTRFLLYPLCILPGMQITINNLIRRSDTTFKANSTLTASFCQSFNLLNQMPDMINLTLDNTPTAHAKKIYLRI